MVAKILLRIGIKKYLRFVRIGIKTYLRLVRKIYRNSTKKIYRHSAKKIYRHSAKKIYRHSAAPPNPESAKYLKPQHHSAKWNTTPRRQRARHLYFAKRPCGNYIVQTSWKKYKPFACTGWQRTRKRKSHFSRQSKNFICLMSSKNSRRHKQNRRVKNIYIYNYEFIIK